MKPQDLRRYAKIVSDIIDSTQSNGEDLNADYEVLRKSIDDKTVSDLGSDRLTQIKTHFQSGTDKYQDNVNKLEQAPVPVKILGKHKILVRAYADYANACQDMTDSLNPEDASIDAKKFNRSEKTRKITLQKFLTLRQELWECYKKCENLVWDNSECKPAGSKFLFWGFDGCWFTCRFMIRGTVLKKCANQSG